MMTATDNAPAVWLGCLACYSAGQLVGKWMSPTDAAEASRVEIHESTGPLARMLAEAHEELWVMDSEYVPLSGEFGMSECAEIGEAFEEIGAGDWPAYLAYAATGASGSPIPDPEEFREAYQGEWDSREDFAQELAEDIGAIPDDAAWPNSYIDWERAARDLFMDYSDEPAPGGRIYVFRNY